MTFDRYRIENDPEGNPIILSTDGTGTSYRAVDGAHDRSIILRVLGDQALASDNAQRIFVDRARFLIELDHPQITRICDTGQSDQNFFYVLSDPGGPTLFDQVRHRPFELEEAVQLQLQLVEILLSLNPQPSVIGRVWPRNLLVTPDLKLYIIAQNLVNPIPPLDMPEFVAPEVLRGSPETLQSTLYSIGSTFYFMLTGQAPYPSNERIEDLIRLQTETSPDYSLLPPSSPITLIGQLLHKDPRERPTSMHDWDRALQRYIRFTPTARGGKEAQPVPMGPQAGEVRFSSEVQEQLQSELSKIRAHTQRLSLELTKRVEKELALTERLKMTESKLEEERQRNVSLLSKIPPKPDSSQTSEADKEKQRLALEWKQLEKAKTELSKEKEAFLKKTQRLKLENPSLGLTGRISLWKQRLKDAPAVPATPPKPPVARIPGPALAAPPTEGKAVSPPKQAPPIQAPAKLPPPPPATSPASAYPKTNAPEVDPVRLRPAPAKPAVFPNRTAVAPATASTATATQAPPRKILPAPVRMKPPTKTKAAPKTTALGRGWIALALLSILFLVGLYKVYRTFYDRADSATDPHILNMWPSDSTSTDDTPEEEKASSDSSTPPATNAEARGARINGELRVEVEVLKNFRLVQDLEWAELLHSMMRLEAEWKTTYPDSLRQVQEDLLQDMKGAAELKSEVSLQSDERYLALEKYLTEQLSPPKS